MAGVLFSFWRGPHTGGLSMSAASFLDASQMRKPMAAASATPPTMYFQVSSSSRWITSGSACVRTATGVPSATRAAAASASRSEASPGSLTSSAASGDGRAA